MAAIASETVAMPLAAIQRLAACALLLAAAALHALPARADGEAVILSINDVYRLHGIDGGAAGGLPRVRALRAELERDHPDLLFLHGGDFLSPSFLGRTFKGAQMIDLMNVMDGSPAQGAFDARMFAAFGNHEFDDTHCSKQGPLADLVRASEFTWLAANLDFTRCEILSPLARAANVEASRIVESGGLRIGLFGITVARDKYEAIVDDPVGTACIETAKLRGAGVDAVVALTHLPFGTDLKILGLGPDGRNLAADARSCTEAPDIVIGGHDHVAMALPSRGPRLFKADADAVSAWVVRLRKTAAGLLTVSGENIALDDDAREDPLTLRLADMWVARHDERFCTADCIARTGDDLDRCMDRAAGGACLAERIVETHSPVETEEIMNRSFETGFGNWLADTVREEAQTDVAFLNAGAIRLNYTLAAGTMITRRHLEEMFPFQNKLVVREIEAAALWRAMVRAIAARGEGGWAHFSGFAARLAFADGGTRLAELVVNRNGDLVNVTPDSTERITIASLSFTLADGDHHGFGLCADGDDVWACKAALEADPRWPLAGDGADLSGFTRLKLLELGPDGGLELATDDRLCEATGTPCLIDRWRGAE